ncbi:MAG: glycosyltransferase family 4 protein [Promethearchaeia archaeon]
MKIAILCGTKPITEKSGNLYEIAKILAEKHSVDIINNKKGHLSYLYSLFNFNGIINFNTHNLILRIIRQIINLLVYAFKNRPDIFMTIDREEYEGPFIVLIAKILRKKSIVRIAGDPIDASIYIKNFFKRLIGRIIIRHFSLKIIKRADRIIVMSKELKKKLIKIGFKKEKIKIIMQPINYYDFKINWNFPLLNNKLNRKKQNILVVGTFSKRKGFDTILKILQNKIIREKYEFLFAGKDYEGYIKDLKKYPNVKFLGHLSKKELIWYYHHVNLLLHCAYIEGFPKVITEAFICGCPIVARDIVNIDRLANYTFKNDNDLLNILLKKNFIRKYRRELPDEFKYNIIKENLLNLIEDLRIN